MPTLGTSTRRFAFALLLFAAALATRVLIEPSAPGRLPFLTFFPAVLLAALCAGYWPALLVLLLSALAGAVILPDALPLKIYAACLFSLVAYLSIYVVQHLLDTRERLREKEAQLALVNRELKHRIKNLFAIAGSVCRQTFQSGGNVEQLQTAIEARLQAISAAQDALSGEASEGADVRDLLTTIVAPMCPSEERLRLNGGTARVAADDITMLGLILNELATNALKHGAWSARQGIVEVATRELTIDDEVQIVWTERNGPEPRPPIVPGLGTKLINLGLRRGTVKHELKPSGLTCEIRLPVSRTKKRSTPSRG